jgi:hypothetical protein
MRLYVMVFNAIEVEHSNAVHKGIHSFAFLHGIEEQYLSVPE